MELQEKQNIPLSSEMEPSKNSENSFDRQDSGNSSVNDTSYQYLWINNEGLLRDEGVLFGISGTDTKEKIEAIKMYYVSQIEITNEDVTALEKNLDIKNSDISSLNEENATIEEKLQKISNSDAENTNIYYIIPILLQLFCYIAICYCNFFLIDYWLTPVFGTKSIITIGIYLMGLFSIFWGKALLYNADQIVIQNNEHDISREKWKIYFEEFGIPTIVSLFICVISYRKFPVEYSLGGFLIFFFLFSLGGKGLINSSFRFRKEWGKTFNDLKLSFKSYKEKRDLTKTIKINQESMKIKSAESDNLKANILKDKQEIKKLMSESDYKISLFKSEYELAKTTSI
jgi:hypothetical protein